MQFKIKKVSNSGLNNRPNSTQKELKSVGFDNSYIKEGAKKHDFLSFKIYDLTPQQATILKQTAIGAGTDCAIHRHVIDFKVEKTDCIISGSINEFEKISEKLARQPFSLKILAEDLKAQIEIHQKKPAKSVIMGILNITENSFSDGGDFLDEAAALKRAEQMINEGATIIDIGAESTAPHSTPVSPEVEIERLVPIIKKIKEKFPKILISADTRNSDTAREAMLMGADIINDVSDGNFDKKTLDVAIELNKKLVIMHTRGLPQTMSSLAQYENVVDEVYFDLKKRCNAAIERGLKPENIIVDVGFGFAKKSEQNLKLMSAIEEFKSLGFEILAGVSRKRFLAEFSDAKIPKNRDEITATTSFYFALKGIEIIRVHNVKLSADSVKFAQAILDPVDAIE